MLKDGYRTRSAKRPRGDVSINATTNPVGATHDAIHLVQINDVLILSLPSPPWIQFLSWINRDIRAEVNSNARFTPRCRIAAHREELLCGLGCKRLTCQT